MPVVQFPQGANFKLVDLPVELVASIIDVTQKRSKCHPARSTVFREAVKARGIDFKELLGAFLNSPVGRLYFVEDGLASGLYFLSKNKKNASLIVGVGARPSPIRTSNAADFVITYAYEELEFARTLQQLLVDRGASVFMVDVEENAGDPYWWLTFKHAIHRGAYFVPILSSSYARRHGSEAEAIEILYTIEATKDDRNWFPILPLQVAGGVDEVSRLGALLSANPGWTADNLDAFLDSAMAIRSGEGLISIGDWSFVQSASLGRQLRDRAPTLDGGFADIVQLQSGELRLPDLSGELRRRFATPVATEPAPPIDDDEYSRLMIEGQNQLDGGDPETAMVCFVQCGVGDRDPEYHRMSLCLEAMGRQAEAMAFLLRTRQKILDRGYYEAAAELHGPSDIDDAEYFKTSFSRSFRATVAERLKRLKPYLEQAELVDVGAVVSTWGGQSHRTVRNPGFPPSWEEIIPETPGFEPTGANSYMRAAYPLAESGQFARAERILAHAVSIYGATTAAAPMLHLMAILAAEQDAPARALDHMVFALDVDPDRNDTREMLKQFLGKGDIRLSIRT